jgi:protein KTI12
MMVGIPCSGKSTRAKEIASFLENQNVDVQIINEELLGLNKAEYLSDPQKEKILRASLKSSVEKFIDSQRVVILDSLNYIKGYRYELFSLARAAKTTICLVWCDTDTEMA